MERGFEIIEHTADVGIRAWAPTPEGVVEETTAGLIEISGVAGAGPGRTEPLSLRARDRPALLVEWLSEIIYIQDAERVGIGNVRVERMTDEVIEGSIEITALDEGGDLGTQVKAVTYHRLVFEETHEGWTATVYLDI